MVKPDHNDKKKILIITYHFPPDSAVGAIRPAKCAKYLSHFGWEPFILSVKTGYYDQPDSSNYDNWQHLIISRTRKLPTPKEMYLSLKKIYLKNFRNISLYTEQQKWMGQPSKHKRESLYTRLHRYLNSMFIYLPDNQIGWFIPATIRGFLLIKRYKFDALLTTSPPHSTHLIGMALHMATGIPWIVDFRDPWNTKTKGVMTRSRLSDYVEDEMIHQVLHRSNAVINVTPEMKAELLTRAGKIPVSKFFVVQNGFDSNELEPFLAEKKYEQFTITYAGSFYLGRNPFLLLKAIADLIRDNRLHPHKIRINLIGNCSYAEGISVESMVQNLGLSEVVRIMSQMPHRDVLDIMAKSHGLLLLAPKQPLQIPAKVYEYIGLGGYIIAVCENGATKNLLKDYPLAFVVDPLDTEGMKNALLSISGKNGFNTSAETKIFREKLQYKHLTGRLVDILKSITQNNI